MVKPIKKSRESIIAARLAKRVNTLRVARGWSIADLAHAAGITRQCANELERGRGLPSLLTLTKICAALSTTPNYLLQDQA